MSAEGALQSYSPKERPLQYDSLSARLGCEPTSGNDYPFAGLLAYTRICVFGHDANDPEFNQPDTASYSIGPATPGQGVFPWNIVWTAWVATQGIRIGKVGAVVPPDDAGGSASDLYPGATPQRLAHAFNNDGLLAIAIQKTASIIELSRYINVDGTEAAPVTFTGYSPVMFNLAVFSSSFQSKRGIVILYLKSAQPGVLFGRFEFDSLGAPYTSEFVIMPQLRVLPLRLLGVERVGLSQVLRYIDVDGRDVSLTSPDYAIDTTSPEKRVKLGVSFYSGRALNLAVPITVPATPDKAKISVAFIKGIVYASTATPASPNNPLATDSASIAVSFENGEVT